MAAKATQQSRSIPLPIRETLSPAAPVRLPPWVRKGHIPCLDGVRAVAISAVILSHLNLKAVGLTVPVLLGHMGVTLFFVLSGFLITLLMLREIDATGAVSLKNFYMRRTLRILPAYYLYLGVMFALAAAGYFHYERSAWIKAVTYLICYSAKLSSSWNIAHLWSLAVEEHFYLLWPATLALLGRKTALKGLCGYIAAAPVLRAIVYMAHTPNLDIDYISLTQMNSIAMGCLLAFAVTGREMPRAQRFLAGHAGRAAAIGIGSFLGYLVLSRSGKFMIGFGDPAAAFSFALILGGLVYSTRNPITVVLNSRPLKAIGLWSYSLYLWQQFCVRQFETSPAVSLVAIFGAALASHYLVERPFLRLKERWASEQSTQTRAAAA